MPFHIIILKKTKMSRCQDAKIARAVTPLGERHLLMNLFVYARQCSFLLMCIKMGGVVNKS